VKNYFIAIFIILNPMQMMAEVEGDCCVELCQYDDWNYEQNDYDYGYGGNNDYGYGGNNDCDNDCDNDWDYDDNSCEECSPCEIIEECCALEIPCCSCCFDDIYIGHFFGSLSRDGLEIFVTVDPMGDPIPGTTVSLVPKCSCGFSASLSCGCFTFYAFHSRTLASQDIPPVMGGLPLVVTDDEAAA